MNITQLRKEIETANLEALMLLEKVADKLRRERVIPFCNARNLRFLAGMGGFNFQQSGGAFYETFEGEHYRKSDKVWQSLYAALMVQGGNINNEHCIGSLMDDYTPPNFKE